MDATHANPSRDGHTGTVELPPEPLSPELALVDPELAATARRMLADRPRFPPECVLRTARESSATTFDPSAEARLPRKAVHEHLQRERGLDGHQPRSRRLAPLAAALVLGLVAGAAVASVSDRSGGPLRSSRTEPDGQSLVHRSGEESLRTATAPPTKGGGTTASAIRSFVWPAVSSAEAYEFQLFRNDALVFRARSAAPRLELPAVWRFRGRRHGLSEGPYRWYVWPISRKNGKPSRAALIQAKLDVAP